jgi:hypothetical protein
MMIESNFGLLGDREESGRVLRRLHSLDTPSGRVIAHTREPKATEDPDRTSI